ncbi:methionyl-tRNA formyltransferase [Flavobacteriaceae bacterium (ex Bugula neritina AB1)]|nr:methionyl-tRNA formyltransferase [Flavobacteriaceae bacterium (ex Bugula neritina AB1)]
MDIYNLEYNTEREKLIIPEYGRHLQKMINQAVAIEDAEERNKVAKAIIAVMGNLQPHLRDVPDFQHKLWDQLFIISDFKLDVEAPYPILTKEKLEERPEPLEYPQNFPKYRFYGNNIKRMIDVANSWEDGDLKTALTYTIANHMKKCYLNWNKDTVEDSVIFNHLYELSNGKINLKGSTEDLSTSTDLMRGKKKKYH